MKKLFNHETQIIKVVSYYIWNSQPRLARNRSREPAFRTDLLHTAHCTLHAAGVRGAQDCGWSSVGAAEGQGSGEGLVKGGQGDWWRPGQDGFSWQDGQVGWGEMVEGKVVLSWVDKTEG